MSNRDHFSTGRKAPPPKIQYIPVGNIIISGALNTAVPEEVVRHLSALVFAKVKRVLPLSLVVANKVKANVPSPGFEIIPGIGTEVVTLLVRLNEGGGVCGQGLLRINGTDSKGMTTADLRRVLLPQLPLPSVLAIPAPTPRPRREPPVRHLPITGDSFEREIAQRMELASDPETPTYVDPVSSERGVDEAKVPTKTSKKLSTDAERLSFVRKLAEQEGTEISNNRLVICVQEHLNLPTGRGTGAFIYGLKNRKYLVQTPGRENVWTIQLPGTSSSEAA